MSGIEHSVITVRETLSVDVIDEKGIAVMFLSADDTEYLVQLPFDEASGLAEMITIALTRVQPQRT